MLKAYSAYSDRRGIQILSIGTSLVNPLLKKQATHLTDDRNVIKMFITQLELRAVDQKNTLSKFRQLSKN